MHWDVEFGRDHIATWIAPGYHRDLKSSLGAIVKTQDGRRARVIDVQFNLRWNQLNAREKKQIKRHYGDGAKRSYHFYTRVILQRFAATQPFFPTVEWFDCVVE